MKLTKDTAFDIPSWRTKIICQRTSLCLKLQILWRQLFVWKSQIPIYLLDAIKLYIRSTHFALTVWCRKSRGKQTVTRSPEQKARGWEREKRKHVWSTQIWWGFQFFHAQCNQGSARPIDFPRKHPSRQGIIPVCLSLPIMPNRI